MGCYSKEDRVSCWDDMLDVRNVVMHSLSQRFSTLPAHTDCPCKTWTDLYYVPRGAWNVFAEACTVMEKQLRKPLMNDYAIPLLFMMSRDLGHCEIGGGCLQQKVRCWGHASALTTNIENMKQHACGHKVNLP